MCSILANRKGLKQPVNACDINLLCPVVATVHATVFVGTVEQLADSGNLYSVSYAVPAPCNMQE